MTPPQQPPPLQVEPRAPRNSTPAHSSPKLNDGPGIIWDLVTNSFTPSLSSPALSAGPMGSINSGGGSTELAWVQRQLDEARRKIRRWEESWQQVEQRAAREAKERALAADSARQVALQKKEEVEAQFQQLQKELKCRGLVASLPELRGCGDMGDIPLPQLHSLQNQLRLDLEAVDGVIFQLHAKQCAACREHAQDSVSHRILCEPCTAECPCCASQPLPW
ncbi:putative E3 ubiquitin-protein ligase UNKL isoform X2 [Suncus etruscus]|uniref:putative E3 ubiquitin-protein ligase UNKL isoform X2 n=1 Tax=Suncus etruscus TaxID=109475 RepID=UPI0021102D27|nr:putative E3 ubiquitin-protein ligase UNKL isoform X2 [Suncus etruscus]